MKLVPIINVDVKTQLKATQTCAGCNYAGCGLTNDGWPHVHVKF